MRFLESSMHGKDIPMLTEEIEIFTRCYVLNRSIQNTCIDMVNVHGVVYESRHSSWAGFPNEFGNLQEHKIRKHRECVQHHSKICGKVLNVRGLECSSPSWTTSTLVNDQAIKWAKAKACVHADSVLCVGRMEQGPGAQERRWKGQVEDLRMYSSCQDAVGIEGEAVEFERTNFQDFRHCQFFKKSRKTQRRRTSNQRTSRTMATLTINKDSGIAQPAKWCSDSKKLTGHLIFTSTSALSRGIFITSMEIL